ncbi:MAG: GNAT family N-acetyltransferase [Candidatus Heimdallarchaeota archaeon]
MKVKVEVFDPESTDDAQWDIILDFFEAFWLELNPDDPLPSRDVVKKEFYLPNPDLRHSRWIVFTPDNARVIGYGRVSVYKESSPGYEQNKHVAFGTLFVDAQYRRSKIGTHLLDTLVPEVVKESKTVFQVGALNPAGIAFCEAFGGLSALTEEESRLKIEEIDWDMIENWRVEGRRRAQGVTIEKFETVDEKDIVNYCNLYTEVLNQVPKGETEWEAKETPETRREREEREKELGTTWTTMITREKDGAISGLTETTFRPDRSSLLYQGLTGVQEKYRSRGLGKWLKAEMMTFVKNNLPSVRSVATDFALTNKPMISINRRLGFRFYKKYVEYKFDIDDLVNTMKR